MRIRLDLSRTCSRATAPCPFLALCTICSVIDLRAAATFLGGLAPRRERGLGSTSMRVLRPGSPNCLHFPVSARNVGISQPRRHAVFNSRILSCSADEHRIAGLSRKPVFTQVGPSRPSRARFARAANAARCDAWPLRADGQGRTVTQCSKMTALLYTHDPTARLLRI